MTAPELTSRRQQFGGWEEAQKHYFENGLTDGLPVVPPTEHRVRAMLQFAGLPPHHVIAVESRISISPLAYPLNVDSWNAQEANN